MSAHPAPELLDRFWADDLDSDSRAAVGDHARACGECRRYLDDLARENEVALAAVPPEAFVSRLEARIAAPRRRFLRAAGALVAVAAAAALIVIVPRPATERLPATDRLKGGEVAGLVVYRKRGEQIRRLEEGDVIRAGDSLRVSLTLSHPSRVGAWLVDGHGGVEPLVPGGAAELRAGEQTLPGAVTVESPCARLWLVVASGGATGRVERTLSEAAQGGGAGGEPWRPPEGAVTRQLECE